MDHCGLSIHPVKLKEKVFLVIASICLSKVYTIKTWLTTSSLYARSYHGIYKHV